MQQLTNIKDTTPNQQFIDRLEELLVQAKAGKVRTMVYAISYDDQGVSSGWCMDPRCHKKLLLGELVLLQNEFAFTLSASDDESATSRILNED